VTRTLVLGDPENVRKDETLRKDALRFLSRRGLRATERLLVESLPERPPTRLVAGLDTEGAVALAARALWGDAPSIATLHFDAYLAEKVSGVLERNKAKNVEVLLATDIPGATVPGEAVPDPAAPRADLIALPFPKSGEALLGRELIEEAHAALPPGGRFLAATDNAKGTWLRKVVKEIFGRVSLVREEKGGVCLAATRTREKAVVRDHRHLTKLTLPGGRTLELESRPGSFGHDRIDAGTKALIERLSIAEDDRVLDLGCGYGPIGLAAATLAHAGKVVMVDSNPRATVQAERNAKRNGIHNVRVLLRANVENLGETTGETMFEHVVANPRARVRRARGRGPASGRTARHGRQGGRAARPAREGRGLRRRGDRARRPGLLDRARDQDPVGHL
jgi:16S rRNA G1207 methylase RsmC